MALITAVIQFVAALCAPVIKIAQPFASPALLLSVFLGVGTVLLLRQKFLSWVAATALASIALLTSVIVRVAPTGPLIGNVAAEKVKPPAHDAQATLSSSFWRTLFVL